MDWESSVLAGDSSSLNIANRLTEVARRDPGRRALTFSYGRDHAGRAAYTQLNFGQLEELCDGYAHGLRQTGIVSGMRTLLMIRPGLDFTALAFALFKIGAVPVMIDPGMGIRGFIRCVREVEPQAMLGIPAAHALRLVLRSHFRSVKHSVVLGGRGWFCRTTTAELLRRGQVHGKYPAATTRADEMAAILFTTGSTGPAKGVVYTHRIFDTQVEILREVYGITEGDTDLPCFPMFALFSTALGASAVIPEMDPTRPATVNPRYIIEAINNHRPTYSFGSPALWRTVTAYCIEHGIKLPGLQKVLMAGAPIPDYIHDRLLNRILDPGSQTHTPYGATEALPVADLTGREVLEETWEKTRQGAGVCVGRPLSCLQVEIIRITDRAIENWDDKLKLEAGETGEITVKGPVVTQRYFNRPEPTKLAKILEPDGTVWHRMGDLGYFDSSGRLWVCGRKSHRVKTASGIKFSLCCEAIFNQHPSVYRSALVGLPQAGSEALQAAIIIEPESGKFPGTSGEREQFKAELLEIAANSRLTQDIGRILFHPSFPVDIRHNAKIKRELLAEWAKRQ